MTTTTYDLDIGQLPATPWLAVGQSPRMPRLTKLRPARFTEADQARDPSAPRTRLVKDVLRVGRWKVGTNPDGSPRWWVVTPETLSQIEASFHAARRNGNEFNLCWGHGNPDTRVVDSRDTIEPIDQLFRQGDTLWASTYVDLATAAELRKASRKVSVRVVDNWMDGAGQTFPMALLHVAVVDLPVMTGQGPFLDLAHLNLSSGASAMISLQPTVDFLNELLAPSGLTIPDSVTEDNFDEVLATVQRLWESQQSGASPGDDPDDDSYGDDATSAPGPDPAAASANVNAELSHVLRRLVTRINDLSQQVTTLGADHARSTYTERLRSLATVGRVNAKAVAALTQTGLQHGWDLSLLAPFEQLRVLDMGRRGKAKAHGKSPRVIERELTEAQVTEAAATLAGVKGR